MRTLFGDSTPFPLDDEFIETLRDATDACVSLLRIDEALDEALDQADLAKAEALREQGRLEAIAAALVRAMEPHMGDQEHPGAGQVSVRVVQAARAELESARRESAERREAAVRRTEATIGAERAGIHRAMEAFLARRELPETAWRVRWRMGEGGGEAPVQAFVEGMAPCGLVAVLEADVPADHRFARPPRVAELEREVVIRLPRDRGWLRRSDRRRERLDRMYLTEVDLRPDRAALVLRRHVKGPAPGLEIVMRAEGQEGPTARVLTESGPGLGGAVPLDGDDIAAVHRLWDHVERELSGLVTRRRRLVSATLEDVPVRDLDRPALLARAMVGSLAPLVREMRRRGATAEELVLKRDLGNGRREELFISCHDLARKWAALTPPRREIFDTYGLADEVTGELTTSDVEFLDPARASA